MNHAPIHKHEWFIFLLLTFTLVYFSWEWVIQPWWSTR